MLAYTFYEGDNRVRRYAETFSSRGDTVDAIVLRQKGSQKESLLNGVRIKKIQERNPNERWKIEYIIKLFIFLIRSSFVLSISHLKKRYDLIHVHSVPDFEVFATFFAKLTGCKIILDIHDIVPELFASKFRVNQKSFQFKLLLSLEKYSTKFADHIIVANHIWHKRLIERSVPEIKCTAVLNYPDLKIFNLKNYQKKMNETPVIIYPGTLSKHQGIETAIRAIGILKNRGRKVLFKIYGKGTDETFLQNLVNGLKLNDCITFNDIVPIHQLPDILKEADLGIEPKSKNTFANEALSTKILEFMIMNIPVIASDTTAHKYYFAEKQIMFFESDNYYNLADCIEFVLKNKNYRDELIKNSSQFIKENNWQKKQDQYLAIVDSLKRFNK
jgi:glycosyltransferase involved in cell wall biosynthesis